MSADQIEVARERALVVAQRMIEHYRTNGTWPTISELPDCLPPGCGDNEWVIYVDSDGRAFLSFGTDVRTGGPWWSVFRTEVVPGQKVEQLNWSFYGF